MESDFQYNLSKTAESCIELDQPFLYKMQMSRKSIFGNVTTENIYIEDVVPSGAILTRAWSQYEGAGNMTICAVSGNNVSGYQITPPPFVYDKASNAASLQFFAEVTYPSSHFNIGDTVINAAKIYYEVPDCSGIYSSDLFTYFGEFIRQ